MSAEHRYVGASLDTVAVRGDGKWMASAFVTRHKVWATSIAPFYDGLSVRDNENIADLRAVALAVTHDPPPRVYLMISEDLLGVVSGWRHGVPGPYTVDPQVEEAAARVAQNPGQYVPLMVWSTRRRPHPLTDAAHRVAHWTRREHTGQTSAQEVQDRIATAVTIGAGRYEEQASLGVLREEKGHRA